MTPHPSAYGPEVAALLGDGGRLMPLGPGAPNESVRPHLAALAAKTDPACLSALYLYHDFLDESHSISQELHTPTGSFLHAVMHRREPDAFNSKYWWRRVGNHPVLPDIATAATGLGYANWTPDGFVDRCESARGAGTAEEELLKRIQLAEWRILFDYCHRAATGGR